MPRTVHPPEWPDKVMFAAMLLIIGGMLGAIFAALRLAGLRISRDLAIHLDFVGPGWSLGLSIVAVFLGLYGIHYQAAVWVWLAILAGILSNGMLGLVPILSFVAIGFLIRSRTEGEETKHDAQMVKSSLWPDKALAASLLLFVGSAVSFLQAFLVFSDALLLPTMLAGYELPLGILSLLAGLWSLYASYEVYRLRRAWTGYVGAALNAASLGFLLIGPALALAAFLCIRQAGAEEEFEEAPAAA